MNFNKIFTTKQNVKNNSKFCQNYVVLKKQEMHNQTINAMKENIDVL